MLVTGQSTAEGPTCADPNSGPADLLDPLLELGLELRQRDTRGFVIGTVDEESLQVFDSCQGFDSCFD